MGGGRWRQGPWWIPGLAVALALAAIVRAPEATGQAVRAIVDAAITATTTALGDDTSPTITLPELDQ